MGLFSLHLSLKAEFPFQSFLEFSRYNPYISILTSVQRENLTRRSRDYLSLKVGSSEEKELISVNFKGRYGSSVYLSL